MGKAVQTKNAPEAVGPYSVGIRAGNFLFVSGQIPMDPKTRQILLGDVGEQTKQVMENIKAIVEAAGYEVADIVRATVYATDIKDFSAINNVYATYFQADPPARAFVEVSALAMGIKVEIDAIAYRE